MKPQSALPWQGLAYLGVVYVAWGSTYLAIRVAVGMGEGFPPFIMVTIRTFGASLILLAWAVAAGRSIRLTRQQIGYLFLLGFLMWMGGNGLVTWAEQRAESGYAALLVGSTPIWTAIIESVLDRRPPTFALLVSLLVGFAGIGVLAAPVLAQGTAADAASLGALLLATLMWSIGSILQRRRPLDLDMVVNSAYQILFGGVILAAVALLVGERLATAPSPIAWLAVAHLILVGSVAGYTSYIQSLRMLPMNVAMTYAYVNPVVAVVLGALVLSEPITPWTIVGMALVLAGVAGVFRSRAT